MAEEEEEVEEEEEEVEWVPAGAVELQIIWLRLVLAFDVK